MLRLRQMAGQTILLTMFTVLLGLVSVISEEREESTGKEVEEAGGGDRLEEWLYRQRAYPLETIPAGAGERMLEQLAQLETGSAPLLQQMATGTNEPFWLPIGPEPIISGQTYGFPRSNVSGRISTLAIDPRYDGVNNRTIYLGGAQGGVWKSEDGGDNWSPLTDDQSSQAVGAIAIDPKSPETIYVGLGEGSRCALCYYGSGLLKSTNGGRDWRLITGPPSATSPNRLAFVNAAFTKIAVDPVTPSTVYATTTYGYTAHATSSAEQVPAGQVGLWRSTDGGENWTNLDPGSTNGVFSAHDVVIDPLNPNNVFVGMRTIGLFRSASKGAPGSWQRMTTGLPDVGVNPSGSGSTSPYRRVALTIGPPVPPSTASTLYAAFAAPNDELLGIYRSIDGGNTWAIVTSPQKLGQANYNLDIAVDPSDGNVVYYGTSTNSTVSGGTLWRSLDGGTSWQDISVGASGGGLHPDTHRITLSRNRPATLFTGNDGGVWRTDNAKSGGVNWFQLNDSLNLTQFMSLALHPTSPDILYGGTQDNGTNLYQGNIGWDHIADGDGGYVLVDQADPRVVYHTFYNINNKDERPQIGPRVSTNRGLFGTWSSRGCFGCTTAVVGNFNPSDRVAFYAPMAQNTAFTSNGNVVYFGTHRLYRTATRGSSWTGLGASTDGFGADLTKGEGVITAIAAFPQLNQSVSPPGETVWVGTNDGNIQVTNNAGGGATTTFTNVTKSPLPNRFISEIALDPGNQQRAVVVFSGFDQNTPTTPGHVFLTTNQGQSWSNISGNLPDVPVTSVAINPTNPNTIYIGTDLGVFQTTDSGQTWFRPGYGLPRIATFAVRYHAATNTLFAATHGRGIFQLTLPGSLSTVSAASYSPAGGAPESIVSAFGSDLGSSNSSAGGIPLPTRLGGTRVAVRDSLGLTRYSPLFYVSSGQINFLIPAGTASGEARITVTTSFGAASSGIFNVTSTSPAIFSANSSGSGVVAGYVLRSQTDGSFTAISIIRYDTALNRYVSVPLEPGGGSSTSFLVLFGTGIRNLTSLSSVSATIGGLNAPVSYAGPQGFFVGVDQVNLQLPSNISALSGRGEVPIVLNVDGRASNTVTISIK